MAVKEINSIDDITGNDFDDEPEGMTAARQTITGKVKGKKTSFRLVEDDGEDDQNIVHSGVTENGLNLFDKSPVPGGRIQTINGDFVNARGHEIDEKGIVLYPERYAEEGSIFDR